VVPVDAPAPLVPTGPPRRWRHAAPRHREQAWEARYVAVLLLVALESLGLPLPGEAALLTASAYAATGRLSIVGVIAAAAVGAPPAAR